MLRHIHRDDFPKREKDLEHFITTRRATGSVAAERYGAGAAD
jgi:hypothetical protein